MKVISNMTTVDFVTDQSKNKIFFFFKKFVLFTKVFGVFFFFLQILFNLKFRSNTVTSLHIKHKGRLASGQTKPKSKDWFSCTF